jgi:hypothetical protein
MTSRRCSRFKGSMFNELEWEPFKPFKSSQSFQPFFVEE